MIEKQLENRMRAAVDDEPPLGFEPREVVHRAARLHRQRRATFAAAGGAGAVVVVATSIAFATAGGGPRPSAGATDAATPTTGSPVPACQSPDEGEPGTGFPGSDGIVHRLRQEVPAAVDEHLGVGTKPVNKFGAHDCPPTIVAGYATDTVIPWLTITMVHARPTLDDGHDPVGFDTKLSLVRERPAEDGARIRVYRMVPDVNGPTPRPLSVVRFGADGMVTAVAESNGSRFSEEQLIALASDTRLAFPLPR